MDTYTRPLLVKPRQDDLLREADKARLSRTVLSAQTSAPRQDPRLALHDGLSHELGAVRHGLLRGLAAVRHVRRRRSTAAAS